MEILGTITLITALVTFIFKITKNITESLVFFSFMQTDDTRLKDDLTNPKEKNINTFTFAIIIVLIAYFITYIITYIFKIGLILSVLIFVLFSIIPLLYVIVIIEKKRKRVLSVKIDKETWYLHGILDDGQYVFKNRVPEGYNKLHILSKEDTIKYFSGYQANPNKSTLERVKIWYKLKFNKSEDIEIK